LFENRFHSPDDAFRAEELDACAALLKTAGVVRMEERRWGLFVSIAILVVVFLRLIKRIAD
jgi:hypothetical protein